MKNVIIAALDRHGSWFTPLRSIALMAPSQRISRFVSILAGVGLPALCLAQYTFVNLGTLGSSGNTFVTGINDDGQVVGWSNGQGFVWQNGTMTALTAPGPGSYTVTGIDGGGVIVGTWNGDGVEWSGNSVVDLGSYGSGIDEITIGGQGAIYARTPTQADGQGSILQYNGTGWTDLGAPFGVPGFIQTAAPNGDPVGGANSSATGFFGWYYSPDSGFVRVQHAGDFATTAVGLNDNGFVVGLSSLTPNNGEATPWVWHSGAFTDLPQETGWAAAEGINDSLVIVGGESPDGASGPGDLLEWYGGREIDLEGYLPSGWSFYNGYPQPYINDGGWITGTMINSEGQENAFILKPSPTVPGTPAALVFSLSGLALRRRRQFRSPTIEG